MQIISNRKIWFVFSGILIGASILFLALFGLKQGLDFTGGSLLGVSFGEKAPEAAVIRESVSSLGLGEIVVQPTDENGAIFRMKTMEEAKHQEVLAALRQKFGSVEELRFESVGPVLGDELKKKAVGSLVLVFAAITLYIAWAFRRVSRPVSSWTYGIITLITAFHDVIIPLGLFALLGKIANVEIGSAFVAAILTVMGYSINDTIVVLDRVRENITRANGTFEEIVEKSVKQSVARSLNTTITTLLALIAVFFFGGETLKYFSLALIAGIATGAYSSIFIASPLLVVWERRKRR